MFNFKVVPDGGDPYTLKVGTRDVLTWEKTSRDKSYTDLVKEPNLKDYYKLCHLAAWRQQLFAGPLEDFEKSHDLDLMADANDMVKQVAAILSQDQDAEDALAAIREVLLGDAEDEEPDPTQSAASADDSSDSPSQPASPRRSGRKKANARS
ncbi:MAG TPA: hypothetical protein VFH76_25770 [Kribbella sp.]|nr:hypothetical protein [Kribbella sp.]